MYRNIMLPKNHYETLLRLSWFRQETVANTVIDMIDFVSQELRVYSPGAICAMCQDISICNRCVFKMADKAWS